MNNKLIYKGLNKFKWRKILIRRSDYLEKLYFENRNKYNLIDSSIDYYISMLELSIYYLKEYDDSIRELYMCNNIIDVRERYFSDYLKEIFFNNNYKNIDIEKIINKNNNYNYDLVIARLFYADYYFDLVEDVFLEKKNQFELIDIIDRVDEYWDYLKYIISIVEKIYPIKKVSLRY